MSPIIVLQEGRFRAVVGASGGPLIVSAVLQTLVRLLADGDDGIDLVAGPRFHHQLLPDNLFAGAPAFLASHFEFVMFAPFPDTRCIVVVASSCETPSVVHDRSLHLSVCPTQRTGWRTGCN